MAFANWRVDLSVQLQLGQDGGHAAPRCEASSASRRSSWRFISAITAADEETTAP